MHKLYSFIDSFAEQNLSKEAMFSLDQAELALRCWGALGAVWYQIALFIQFQHWVYVEHKVKVSSVE